jgi:anthranilate synthase component 2
MGEVFHGVATEMEVVESNADIFRGIPQKFEAARYHSWIASKENFPRTIAITAVDEDGEIQAIQHKEFNVSAVQFHPESILTEVGEQIVRNFLETVK